VYTIQLNSAYITGAITVTIKSIINPDQGTTNGFDVSTSYDGVVLDVTDGAVLSGRTITLTTSTTALIMQSGVFFTP
jgi:hypothetical protein